MWPPETQTLPHFAQQRRAVLSTDGRDSQTARVQMAVLPVIIWETLGNMLGLSVLQLPNP